MNKSEVKKIIDISLGLNEDLNEAYIARPKEYDLKTEMLLSKTKDAHLDLYENYIQSLNNVSARLDTVNRKEANSNSSDFRSLKHNEQYLINAVHFHELYFANIGDPYSEIGMDSRAFMRLNRDFGTFEDWQRDFIAAAMSCTNGWAVCMYSFYLKKYVNVIIDNHSDNLILGYPILVLDMFEHARRDYLNNKKDYVVAMMKEINWAIVEKRIEKSDVIASVIQ